MTTLWSSANISSYINNIFTLLIIFYTFQHYWNFCSKTSSCSNVLTPSDAVIGRTTHSATENFGSSDMTFNEYFTGVPLFISILGKIHSFIVERGQTFLKHSPCIRKFVSLYTKYIMISIMCWFNVWIYTASLFVLFIMNIYTLLHANHYAEHIL